MPRCADPGCGRWRPSLQHLAEGRVRRLGALQFNGRWYCSRACVEQAARIGLDVPASSCVASAGLPPLKVGVLLRHTGAITQTELETALMTRVRTGLRLGEQLERLGFATGEQVLRALATQAGVSYLTAFDVAKVERGVSSLPVEMVRALGLVPFEEDEVRQRLRVACAAPVPRVAVRALATLTGWTPEVYLVTDRVFVEALERYRPARVSPVAHRTLAIETVGAAAALVADAAAEQRVVTMRHAACKDYLWVRVEGSRRVSDLLVRGDAGVEECQAELTAH